ncbi:hypothetical protein ACSBR2_009355 [Camellia fascicularis]
MGIERSDLSPLPLCDIEKENLNIITSQNEFFFNRVQSVPDRCDTEWRLHATDRRGRAGTDWSVHHMRYIQLWDARRDSIVQADWSDGVLPSPDPYMLWYRLHTHLLVGNPSHLSEAEYQAVEPSLEALVVRVGRSYHLAKDALFRRDGQLGLQALAEIRELLYEGIQNAHRVDCLHFGDYGVHSAAAVPDTSVSSTSVPPTSAPATAGPWTLVTPPHDTLYISPYYPHVHPTQHADPDWTPPRFMHDVVTPPTQLPPAFLGTTSTAPMSTHDAVLTDISHVDDEAHIVPLPRARGRGRGYGRGGRRGRSRGAGRGRGRGPAADRDTVAPDEGVSQLTAVSDLQAETGSGAADVREGGSHSQAPQAVSGGPHAGEGVPDIQRVYCRRPMREVHGRGCETGGRLGH